MIYMKNELGSLLHVERNRRIYWIVAQLQLGSIREFSTFKTRAEALGIARLYKNSGMTALFGQIKELKIHDTQTINLTKPKGFSLFFPHFSKNGRFWVAGHINKNTNTISEISFYENHKNAYKAADYWKGLGFHGFIGYMRRI